MALVGRAGLVKIGTDTVASLKSWKLNTSKGMADITAFGDTWKSQVPTLGEWSADCEGSWVVSTDTNGQTVLNSYFLAGTSVTLKLYVNSTNYYSGTAYIEKMDTSANVDGVVTVTFSFKGSGAVSYS